MKKELFIERVLLFLALSSIGSLLIITVFIFEEGLPLIAQIGLKNFLLSSHWAPTRGHFGILAMIISSVFVTLGALVLGVPLGLACAITLAEFAPERVKTLLKPTLELLAGIPSVVYGFLGVIWLVPLIRDYLGGPGLSLLAGSVILGIMILPTVISISIDALTAVPDLYRDGSIALGATNWQTVHRVVLPAAASGIITAIILGMGRAIGETMAGYHGGGQRLENTHVHPGPGTHAHRQHCPGAGLRLGPPPGGPVCHRHCPVHYHHDSQFHRHYHYSPEISPCASIPGCLNFS